MTTSIVSLDLYRDCPFCLKLLYEPVSTLCGHTFCLLCMQRFLLTSDANLRCPICRDDLTYLRSALNHLKTNTILHNIFRQNYTDEYATRRMETEKEREQIIRKRLLIGNTHQLLSCDHENIRHEWTLFVKLADDDDEQQQIRDYIKRVTVTLHPTFSPSQIVLDQPPFCLTRIGWGVFTIYLTIEFQDRWNKADFRTSWFLSFANKGNQKVVEVEFQKNPETMEDDSVS